MNYQDRFDSNCFYFLDIKVQTTITSTIVIEITTIIAITEVRIIKAIIKAIIKDNNNNNSNVSIETIIIIIITTTLESLIIKRILLHVEI